MGDSIPCRSISVHQRLGGGSVTDAVLWRSPARSVAVLSSATGLWLLFEFAEYNLLSFSANVLLLVVVILFFWAKSATLLNRPLPPLPDLEISEERVGEAAEFIQIHINRVLSVAHDIAIGRNFLLFVKVSFCLWVASYIGSLCSFLTLSYIGVLLSFSVPVVYEKYHSLVDEKLGVIHRQFGVQSRRIDELLMNKVPFLYNKEKKTQ